MRREIVAFVDGEVDAVLGAWTPPEGVRVRRGTRMEATFPDSCVSAICELEAAIDTLRAGGKKISMYPLYRAMDFSRDELLSADLIWMHGASSWMEVVGPPPLIEIRCRECGVMNVDLGAADHLTFRARRRPLWLGRKAVLVYGLALFHRSLIAELERAQMKTSLALTPCRIEMDVAPAVVDYCWVRPATDLGQPRGGIVYGKACVTCGREPVVENRSFVKTFERARWNGENFATSGFYGPQFVYVSQPVFRALDGLPSEAKGELVFEPLKLE